MVEEREVFQREIYWAVLKNAYKGESIQEGIRPVLIVSNDKNNKYCTNVNVIPITSKIEKKLPIHVELGVEHGLLCPSIALIEQERPIPKSALGTKIGEVDEDTYKKIERAMQIHKGRVEPFDIYRVKRLIWAIIQAQYVENGKFIKSALVNEFKSYCDSYGKDYKTIFYKYKNQAYQAERPLARIQAI